MKQWHLLQDLTIVPPAMSAMWQLLGLCLYFNVYQGPNVLNLVFCMFKVVWKEYLTKLLTALMIKARKLENQYFHEYFFIKSFTANVWNVQ